MPDMKQFPDFVRALPEVDFPFSGVRGWLIGGAGQQVVFAEFSETVEVPEHQHEEQWELVLAGAVDLHCDGTTTRYAHQSQAWVRPGQQVAAGQVIGLVGSTGASTGPHLHFEVRTAAGPIDPRTWLP